MKELHVLLLLRQHNINNVNVYVASKMRELDDVRDAFIIVDSDIVFRCEDASTSTFYFIWYSQHDWYCEQCSVMFINSSGTPIAAYCASRNVFLADNSVEHEMAFRLYMIARMLAKGRVEYASTLMDPWHSVASLIGNFARRVELNAVSIDTRVCRQRNVDVIIDSDGIMLLIESSGTTRYVTIGGKLYELGEELRYWYRVEVHYGINGKLVKVVGSGYVECCGKRYPHPNINRETGRVCLGSYKLPALDVSRDVCAQLANVRDNIVRVLSRPELLDAHNRLDHLAEVVKMRMVSEWRG